MRQTEVKKRSTVELQEELAKSRKEYSDLRMAHTMSPLDNPLQVRKVRRTIARISTELRNRELND